MSRALQSFALVAVVAATTGLAAWQPGRAQTSSSTTATAPATGAPAVAAEEAEGVIFERQQVMKRLEEDSDLLGDIVAGAAPREKLAPTARSIATAAKESLATFVPNVPGGRSKPEVWTQWADYSKRMNVFAEKAEEMAKQAEADNMDNVMLLMTDALPCKGCHDAYRTPKKKPAA